MIRNNLAALLAERSLKITKVANDTDLSRNTITNTAQNDGKMIQLETVNILCRYLNITPGEFFSFLPYDTKFSVYSSDGPKLYPTEYEGVYKLVNLSFDCYLSVIYQDKSYSYDINVVIDGSSLYLTKENSSDNTEDEYEITFNFLSNQNDPKYNEFKEMWLSMPAGFKSDLQKKMVMTVEETFIDNVINLHHSVFPDISKEMTTVFDFESRIIFRQSFADFFSDNFQPQIIDNKPSLDLQNKLPYPF